MKMCFSSLRRDSLRMALYSSTHCSCVVTIIAPASPPYPAAAAAPIPGTGPRLQRPSPRRACDASWRPSLLQHRAPRLTLKPAGGL